VMNGGLTASCHPPIGVSDLVDVPLAWQLSWGIWLQATHGRVILISCLLPLIVLDSHTRRGTFGLLRRTLVLESMTCAL
jgi:hypothetical protein